MTWVIYKYENLVRNSGAWSENFTVSLKRVAEQQVPVFIKRDFRFLNWLHSPSVKIGPQPCLHVLPIDARRLSRKRHLLPPEYLSPCFTISSSWQLVSEVNDLSQHSSLARSHGNSAASTALCLHFLLVLYFSTKIHKESLWLIEPTVSSSSSSFCSCTVEIFSESFAQQLWLQTGSRAVCSLWQQFPRLFAQFEEQRHVSDERRFSFDEQLLRKKFK